jgi:hypothetical protein
VDYIRNKMTVSERLNTVKNFLVTCKLLPVGYIPAALSTKTTLIMSLILATLEGGHYKFVAKACLDLLRHGSTRFRHGERLDLLDLARSWQHKDDSLYGYSGYDCELFTCCVTASHHAALSLNVGDQAAMHLSVWLLTPVVRMMRDRGNTSAHWKNYSLFANTMFSTQEGTIWNILVKAACGFNDATLAHVSTTLAYLFACHVNPIPFARVVYRVKCATWPGRLRAVKRQVARGLFGRGVFVGSHPESRLCWEPTDVSE